MKAFLLAAGFGKRLKPITDFLPKPLIPVLNVPSICYSLMHLREAGISQVVCNVHHRYQDIIDYFEIMDNFGFDVTFSVEEEILGTGGGLMKCRSLLEHEPFVLINSDIVADLRLSEVISTFLDSSKDGLIVVKKDQEDSGTVSLSGNVVADINDLLESGLPASHDYTGIAVLTPAIFDHLTVGYSCIVQTGYRGLLQRNSLSHYESLGQWYDIGTLETFRKVNIDLIKKGGGLSKRLLRSIGISPHKISPGATVSGKARIRNSVIGERCVVKEKARIMDSVMLPGARAGSGYVLESSVLW